MQGLELKWRKKSAQREGVTDLQRPYLAIVSSMNRLHSSFLVTSPTMTFTSEAPLVTARSATADSWASRRATSTKRAPLFAYWYVIFCKPKSRHPCYTSHILPWSQHQSLSISAGHDYGIWQQQCRHSQSYQQCYAFDYMSHKFHLKTGMPSLTLQIYNVSVLRTVRWDTVYLYIWSGTKWRTKMALTFYKRKVLTISIMDVSGQINFCKDNINHTHAIQYSLKPISMQLLAVSA